MDIDAWGLGSFCKHMLQTGAIWVAWAATFSICHFVAIPLRPFVRVVCICGCLRYEHMN